VDNSKVKPIVLLNLWITAHRLYIMAVVGSAVTYRYSHPGFAYAVHRVPCCPGRC
jgi:hypothetical protein